MITNRHCLDIYFQNMH